MPSIGKKELAAHFAAKEALDNEFRAELAKVENEFKKHLKLSDAYKAQENMMYEIFTQDKWLEYDLDHDYYLKLSGSNLLSASYSYWNRAPFPNVREHALVRRNRFYAGEILICRGGEPLIFPGTLVVCTNMACSLPKLVWQPSRELVLLPGPQKVITPTNLFNHFEVACGVDDEIRKDYQVAFMAWQDGDKRRV